MPYINDMFYAMLSVRSNRMRNLLIAFIINYYLVYGRDEKSSAEDGFSLKTNPEAEMTAAEIVSHWGFQSETYDVVTADGYILTLLRILPKKKLKNIKPPVVLLQHCLECSCVDWINNPPEQSAGFYFSEAGFDVWLGNFRGNRYSNKHLQFSPIDEAYWNFSFDEMAKYDLPAMIDKALEVTKSSRLYYVGFSQGTLTAFAKFSEDPILSEKIIAFFALAPVYSLENIRGPFYYLATMAKYLSFDLIFGRKAFLPSSFALSVAKRLCPKSLASYLCGSVIFLIAGYPSDQINKSRLPIYLSHTPAGTSSKNVHHFVQLVQSGKCRKFDYGSAEKNKLHYDGRETPPEYDVSKIRIPTIVFWSNGDALATEKDVETHLLPRLGNVVRRYKLENFNHLDFIWGMKAAEEIYSKIKNYITTNECAF